MNGEHLWLHTFRKHKRVLLPLCTHRAAVAYDLVAVFLRICRIEAGDFALPQAISHICKRIALATETKDDLLAPICPVFNADIKFHVTNVLCCYYSIRLIPVHTDLHLLPVHDRQDERDDRSCDPEP